MIVIKILLIGATLAFGWMTLRDRQPATHQAVRRIVLLLLVPTGIVAVAFPDTTVWAAHLVGVKRGTDLLLYVFVMTFLFTTLACYQRLHQVEQQLVRLTRELALQAGHGTDLRTRPEACSMTARTATGAHRWRVPLLVGTGLLLLQLGWILALAPYWGIDEFDHAYRASSVAAGHWQPGDDAISGSRGRGDLIPVRADVAARAHGACAGRPYTGELNCRPLTELGGDEVLIASAAARYNPAYYAVVGTVAKPFHGAAYLYALRIASAVLCSLLLVLVLRLALAGAATHWPLLATLTALLPTTVYSTAVAAPNGLEMIAGLGTWVALQVVVGGPRGVQRRVPAYGLLALNAAVLAETHTLGPVWLALILAVTEVQYGPVRVLKALWPRRRTEAALALATAAAVAFQVVWVIASGVNDPTSEKSTFAGDPWTYVAQGLVLWPLQAIGAFPMRNDRAPLAVYALVLLLTVLLVGSALRRVTLRSRHAAAMLLVGVLAFVVPAYLTVRTFHQLGAAWQGRYASPFAVGLLVLAGLALDRRGRFSARARAGVAAAAGVLVLAQVLGQWSMRDGQTRMPELVIATGWSPPSPAVLVLLALGATVCWCTAAYRFHPAEDVTLATAGRDENRDVVRA